MSAMFILSLQTHPYPAMVSKVGGEPETNGELYNWGGAFTDHFLFLSFQMAYSSKKERYNIIVSVVGPYFWEYSMSVAEWGMSKKTVTFLKSRSQTLYLPTPNQTKQLIQPTNHETINRSVLQS